MVYKNYRTINKSSKIISDMGSPWGIAVSRDGALAVDDYLYVTDHSKHRV